MSCRTMVNKAVALLALFAACIAVAHASGESCSSGGLSGVCGLPSACVGQGTTLKTGLCPGGNDNVCCLRSGQTCGNGGRCTNPAICIGSNVEVVSGLCPGGNDYKCCQPKSSGGGAAKIVSCAKGYVGNTNTPYSWGGGNYYGPTNGIKQTESPYCDDTHVSGFDCSGLSLHCVYQGTGKKIDHYTVTQYNQNAAAMGSKVAIANVQPGDLVFFGTSSQNIWHVAIYVGPDTLVEAPGHYANCTGMPPRTYALSNKSNVMPYAVRFW